MISSFTDSESPPQERWPPLGASSSPGDNPVTVEPKSTAANKIEQLENEKEQLGASLLALTTRFAQIQFRLHQITEANPEDRESLLKDLENFAHQGCIEPQLVVQKRKTETKCEKDASPTVIEQHRAIINELKTQLNDLESFAYEQGAGSLPQSVQIERQQAVIERLQQSLNLHVNADDIAKSSVDDLKTKVDDAVAEIVNPAKMKEKLVDHLQTQIQDLERFVEFLQGEAESERHKSSGSVTSLNDNQKTPERKESTALIQRTLAILQIFSLTHFACGAQPSSDETILVDTKSVLNNLEKVVLRIRFIATNRHRTCDGESDLDVSPHSTDKEKGGCRETSATTDDLTQAVRRGLCSILQEILADGLVRNATGRHISVLMRPISCLLPRNLKPSYAAEAMHPWEFFLDYYEVKHGPEFASNPSRMLSRSFNLDGLSSSGEVAKKQSTKCSLLEAIHLIVNEHGPLKRSFDAMFIDFVCLGLNAGRLSRWIRLVGRTPSLVSKHYTDSSYVARTGLEGVASVLSKLDSTSFQLPVDVAVRPFKNINDAF